MRVNESSYGTHWVVELNSEERNLIFDPFDPLDDHLPSYLHHAGHRYIKQDAYDWMLANIGEPSIDWSILSGSKIIHIMEKDKAALFKLTYSL